ncbi:MAG: hypothetical protein E7311_06500 [Clostridiales bacterium]|nr:hypothetical protein [Clostridiales bacterium]
MNFVECPNIPNKKVSKVIVDYRISEESEKCLNTIGIECIKTKKCNSVYDEISGHTDIQLIHLGENELIVEKSMYNEYSEIFKNIDVNLIKGDTILKDKYPLDIAYNGCIIGNKFIHNLKYTDEVLLNKIEQKGFRLIDINQGYSKCSISVVNGNNIITSDRKIEKELSKYLNVLYIENEDNIKLGKMQGFIGGATGLISQDVWCINGDINRLKNCNKILDFLNLNNIKVMCLNDSEVIDIGSILPIIY